MLDIAIASRSDRGGRASNEDALGVGRAGPSWFAVLSDGAGGHARGAAAARHVVARIDSALRASAATCAPAPLTQALLSAHASLQDEQIGAEGRQRMHATAVVLWLDPDRKRAVWAHVGDSRLYRLRHGRVEPLTADDSVVQHLQASGALTAEQAADHPLKNQLLAAVGMQEAIDPHTPADAVPLLDGDVFLLCSDGWWGLLTDADIAGTLFEADTPDDWLGAMQALIVCRGDARHDNFSAIAVWAVDPAETTQTLVVGPAKVVDPHGL